jgi:hypothetical protein
MPFFPPYKERFVPGDLVYGLSLKRMVYFLYEEPFRVDHNVSVHTIDQYSTSYADMERRNLVPIHQLEFLEALSKHPRYALRPFEDKYDPGNLKKKLKCGLEWMATNGRGSAVHFLLDGINMGDVVFKFSADTPGGERRRPYTAVELRWIYRNRHDPRVQKCIQFWLKGKPTSPPWVPGYNDKTEFDFSHYWKIYERQMSSKSQSAGLAGRRDHN